MGWGGDREAPAGGDPVPTSHPAERSSHPRHHPKRARVPLVRSRGSQLSWDGVWGGYPITHISSAARRCGHRKGGAPDTAAHERRMHRPEKSQARRRSPRPLDYWKNNVHCSGLDSIDVGKYWGGKGDGRREGMTLAAAARATKRSRSGRPISFHAFAASVIIDCAPPATSNLTQSTSQPTPPRRRRSQASTRILHMPPRRQGASSGACSKQ